MFFYANKTLFFFETFFDKISVLQENNFLMKVSSTFLKKNVSHNFLQAFNYGLYDLNEALTIITFRFWS